MFCPDCGTQFKDEAVFCANCGRNLKQEQESQVIEQSDHLEESTKKQSLVEEDDNKSSRKKVSDVADVVRSMCRNPVFLLMAVIFCTTGVFGILNAETVVRNAWDMFNVDVSIDVFYVLIQVIKVLIIVDNVALILGFIFLIAFGFKIMRSITPGIFFVQMSAIISIFLYLIYFFVDVIYACSYGEIAAWYSEWYLTDHFEVTFFETYKLILFIFIIILFAKVYKLLESAKAATKNHVMFTNVGGYIVFGCILLALGHVYILIFDMFNLSKNTLYYFYGVYNHYHAYDVYNTVVVAFNIAACLISVVAVLVYKHKLKKAL